MNLQYFNLCDTHVLEARRNRAAAAGWIGCHRWNFYESFRKVSRIKSLSVSRFEKRETENHGLPFEI